jgi:hypothetical protein
MPGGDRARNVVTQEDRAEALAAQRAIS